MLIDAARGGEDSSKQRHRQQQRKAATETAMARRRMMLLKVSGSEEKKTMLKVVMGDVLKQEGKNAEGTGRRRRNRVRGKKANEMYTEEKKCGPYKATKMTLQTT